MTFVWDEKKNRDNIRKHGIDFRDVVAVVVYVEWEDEETIRIISARKATAYESDQYEKGVPH